MGGAHHIIESTSGAKVGLCQPDLNRFINLLNGTQC
jgi:hypothetical protein